MEAGLTFIECLANNGQPVDIMGLECKGGASESGVARHVVADLDVDKCVRDRERW